MLRVLFIFLFAQINLAQELESKCPDYFEYDNSKNEYERWYGEITLSSEYTLAGYWVELGLTNTAEVFGVQSNQPLRTKDNKNYILVARDDKIEPGKPVKIPIFVKYDLVSPPIPEVASIHINGRQVCPMQNPRPVGISPCPGIFSYDPDQAESSEKWFGTISLNFEYDLRGLYLEFHLNGKADLIGAFNYRIRRPNAQETMYWNFVGDITTKDNRIYTITNSSFVLPHGHTLSLPFFVKYDNLEGTPLVNTVVVNGRVICQGSFKDLTPQIPLLIDSNNEESFPTRSQITEEPVATLYTAQSSTAEPELPDLPEVYEDDADLGSSFEGYQCGVQDVLDKVIGGSTTTIRKHPWHGIIFTNGRYSCGMTLISRRHAVTAAHCFYSRNRLVNSTSLSFAFGVDNLKDLRNAQTARLSKIHFHPDYKFHVTRFDLVVLTFANELKITETVVPVCLWSGESTQQEIVNKTGVIVGFGQTERGEISNILREAKILVVDQETCREKDRFFYAEHLSINSFCAGNVTTGIGSCRGDSGGGFYFKKPGRDIWEIRGVTSTSKSKNSDCDTGSYALYTDVARFKDWILNMMLT